MWVRSSSINLQKKFTALSLQQGEEGGKEIKETEHHKTAGSNADELTSYFLAIRKRPLLAWKCNKNREKETVFFLLKKRENLALRTP
jgi:hypothetical protein